MAKNIRRGIYIWTDASNGMQYVGWSVDIIKRIDRHYRCEGSSPYFHAALAKRPDQFSVLIIDYPNAKDNDLKLLEESYIKAMGTISPNGYNLTQGGDGVTGYHHSPDVKKKISDANKGVPKPYARGNRNPMANPEIAAKISESKMGDKNTSAQYKQKHGHGWNKGKPVSEKTRQKISKSNKGISRPCVQGDNNPMSLKNKQHREGVKQLTLFEEG